MDLDEQREIEEGLRKALDQARTRYDSAKQEHVIALLPELIHDLPEQSNMRRIAEVDPDSHVSPLQDTARTGGWWPEP